MLYITEWFFQLHNARASGYGGPCAITFSDIKYWKELYDVEITPTEVEIIQTIDHIFLRIANEEMSKK